MCMQYKELCFKTQLFPDQQGAVCWALTYEPGVHGSIPGKGTRIVNYYNVVNQCYSNTFNFKIMYSRHLAPISSSTSLNK